MRRGFDFEFATRIFASTYVEFDDTRRDYGERRVVALGVADGIALTVVFTDRVGEERAAIRPIISACLSNRRSVVVMSKPSMPASHKATPSRGRAKLARLRRVSNGEIARTSPAALHNVPENFWRDARVVTPVAKQAISIRLDTDVIEWFRATGPRYQTRMNAVLRSYVDQVAPPAQSARKKPAV